MQKKKQALNLTITFQQHNTTTKKKIGREKKKKTSFKAHQKYAHRAGGC